ncbi:MAG TPA: hypothetical protein VK936_13710 [Longimicrobiales bacterium]|nr:hypothetical protein [Longimicrobiales bacterium]
MANPGDGPTGGTGQRDPVKDLQARLEAALDEVRPKIRKALEELDSRVDEAMKEIRPRAQNAVDEVKPRVDQFVSDVQPRLDSLLKRLQTRIEDLRRELDERAAKTTARAGQTDGPVAGELPGAGGTATAADTARDEGPAAPGTMP